jgi:hypothetical protein
VRDVADRRNHDAAAETAIRPKVSFGSEARAHSALELGLDTGDEPTLAVVALLQLKRTTAISAVEGHLIERVNGGYGPETSIEWIWPKSGLSAKRPSAS